MQTTMTQKWAFSLKVTGGFMLLVGQWQPAIALFLAGVTLGWLADDLAKDAAEDAEFWAKHERDMAATREAARRFARRTV